MDNLASTNVTTCCLNTVIEPLISSNTWSTDLSNLARSAVRGVGFGDASPVMCASLFPIITDRESSLGGGVLAPANTASVMVVTESSSGLAPVDTGVDDTVTVGDKVSVRFSGVAWCGGVT